MTKQLKTSWLLAKHVKFDLVLLFGEELKCLLRLVRFLADAGINVVERRTFPGGAQHVLFTRTHRVLHPIWICHTLVVLIEVVDKGLPIIPEGYILQVWQAIFS